MIFADLVMSSKLIRVMIHLLLVLLPQGAGEVGIQRRHNGECRYEFASPHCLCNL
jgi:hypothetical protein